MGRWRTRKVRVDCGHGYECHPPCPGYDDIEVEEELTGREKNLLRDMAMSFLRQAKNHPSPDLKHLKPYIDLANKIGCCVDWDSLNPEEL
jgi:hypothetical protein